MKLWSDGLDAAMKPIASGPDGLLCSPTWHHATEGARVLGQDPGRPDGAGRHDHRTDERPVRDHRHPTDDVTTEPDKMTDPGSEGDFATSSPT
jgi:hypothetical protein